MASSSVRGETQRWLAATLLAMAAVSGTGRLAAQERTATATAVPTAAAAKEPARPALDLSVPADEATRKRREAETQQQLEKLRTEIKALVDRQRSTETEKGGIVVELRERETKIAAAAKEIRTLDETLATQQRKLAELDAQRGEIEGRLAIQREALAGLLRSAYALGRHEDLKLLLQQDDVAAISRVLAYHRYFQRARIERIQGLLGDLAELARLQQAIREQNAQLDATRSQRQTEIDALEAERVQRRRLLEQIDATLKDQQSRLAVLGKDEKALVDLIAKLRDVFADIPPTLTGAEPFAQRRGSLPWPLAGKVAVAYGANDESGRAISGLVIAAKAGAPVRAIARGRVAYADWLKGYGLLVILDHGEGFMSLYGYNDALRKEVGDWVDAGEIIASAGSSGGRANPGLYFELREKGKPLDPRTWLAAQRP